MHRLDGAGPTLSHLAGLVSGCARPSNPKLDLPAASLRNRIQIQQKTSQPDGRGGFHSATWSTIASAWASIEPKAGMEIWVDDHIETVGRVKIRLRYLAGLTTAHRIVGPDGTIFNIREVLDIEFRHAVHELTCDSGEGNG